MGLTSKEIYEKIKASPYRDGEEMIKQYAQDLKIEIVAMVLDKGSGNTSLKICKLYEIIAFVILETKIK